MSTWVTQQSHTAFIEPQCIAVAVAARVFFWTEWWPAHRSALDRRTVILGSLSAPPPHLRSQVSPAPVSPSPFRAGWLVSLEFSPLPPSLLARSVGGPPLAFPPLGSEEGGLKSSLLPWFSAGHRLSRFSLRS